VCGARYSPNFGQLCEIVAPQHEGGGRFYAMAPCPDADDKDLKAMIVEHYHATAETPQQLYDELPEVKPSVNKIIRKAVRGDMWKGGGAEDVFKFTPEGMAELDELPEWSWKQIYNFFGIEPPAKPESKNSRRKKHRG
jgi:hypothetical protein